MDERNLEISGRKELRSELTTGTNGSFENKEYRGAAVDINSLKKKKEKQNSIIVGKLFKKFDLCVRWSEQNKNQFEVE